MIPNKEHENIMSMKDTKEPSTIKPAPREAKISFKEYRDYSIKFFEQQEYKHKLSFQEAWNFTVSEDSTPTDLINNINEIIYNHYTQKSDHLSLTDKKNFRNLQKGLQLITSSMEQYSNDELDKDIVAALAGYTLKVIRNFYHD